MESMGEPIHMNATPSFADFVIAGFSGAAVVSFGGLYALFFAWSRLRPRALWRRLSVLAFALLATALLLLARALHFDALWNGVALFLLAAYLLAPMLIWRLT